MNEIKLALCATCGEVLGVLDHIRIRDEHLRQENHRGIRYVPYVMRPDAEDCPNCNGEGIIERQGYSVNPFSGVPVADPQAVHVEPCRVCEGTGETP